MGLNSSGSSLNWWANKLKSAETFTKAEEWDGKTYSLTARIEADPEVVAQSVKELRMNRVPRQASLFSLPKNLKISDVAKIADCHVNTVKNYEQRGYIKSLRDNNNFRRYSQQDALKLKKILNIRRPD